MAILDRITALMGRRQPARSLVENAKKALEMKRAAGPQTNIPEHQTSDEGGVQGSQVNYSDTAVGKEPTHTPNLKRSHNPRSGDA